MTERRKKNISYRRVSFDLHIRSDAAEEELHRSTKTNVAKLTEKLRLVRSQANEMAAAPKKELDDSLNETVDQNTDLFQFLYQSIEEFEVAEAVEKRDLLRINVRDLQEDLEPCS